MCIEELHCLSAAKECFTVELKKGFWARFTKDERRKIISATCHVNRVIYDVMLMVCFDNHELSENSWPCVDIGEKEVDPLRDARVAKVLQKQSMEHCCVPWSFGQEGDEEEHKLQKSWGIATNADGQLIVADSRDITMKVFNSSGNFLFSFIPQADDADTKLNHIHDIDTDMNSNIYALAMMSRLETELYAWEVQVYNRTGDLQHKFPVREENCADNRLAVSKNEVLVLQTSFKDVVDMYDKHDGGFVCSFGKGILKNTTDIAADSEDRVMVVDLGNSCVHVFTEEGEQLSKFNINIQGDRCERIGVHPTGEHVVVAGKDRLRDLLRVTVCTKDGEVVRSIQRREEDLAINWCQKCTVTMEGHIAMLINYTDADDPHYISWKVFVL